jgi:transglutaminase-like putative cysteine protease
MRFGIEHITHYSYSQPVQLGQHRLLVRPAPRADVDLKVFQLAVDPEAKIAWTNDAYGNSVALATFDAPVEQLTFTVKAEIECQPHDPFQFLLEAGAERLPLSYPSKLARELRPWLSQAGENDELNEWLRPFLDFDGGADTLACLTAINRSIPLAFTYRRREEHGVQTPQQTLHLRSGSCRDFAQLLMSAARHLGVAARFVSGYLIAHEANSAAEQVASGATHAWVELYLPGAGWKGFDPTCGLLETEYHVRVAAVPEAHLAPPVAGTFVGNTRLATGMTVDVRTSVLPG